MRLQPELGRRIAVARSELGMSQLELSKVAGVDIQTIATIEKGTRPIYVKELISVIEATGKDVEYFTDPNRLVGEGRWTFKTSGE